MMSEPVGTKPAAPEPQVPEPSPPSPAEAEQTAAELRSLLSGLGTVEPPTDLSEKVPQIIERRSRGRFFGRRRLFDRIPFVWVSLLMLITTALLYAVLRMAPAVFSP
jgi:hypothetical protein